VLDVLQTDGGVLLRPAAGKSGRSTEEILREVREIAARYKGPPVSVEQMNETIAEGWAQSGTRGLR
jgi:hypothetical protein